MVAVALVVTVACSGAPSDRTQGAPEKSPGSSPRAVAGAPGPRPSLMSLPPRAARRCAATSGIGAICPAETPDIEGRTFLSLQSARRLFSAEWGVGRALRDQPPRQPAPLFPRCGAGERPRHDPAVRGARRRCPKGGPRTASQGCAPARPAALEQDEGQPGAGAALSDRRSKRGPPHVPVARRRSRLRGLAARVAPVAGSNRDAPSGGRVHPPMASSQ